MEQKGPALKSLLGAIERLHGHDGLEAVLRALPPEHEAEARAVILPVKWYPVSLLAAIHVAVRDVLGKGEWEESRRLGHEAAKIDFGGVYRVLLRTVRYDTVWDRIQLAWSHYNSQGEGKWIERRAGGATGIVTGVAGFNLGQWYSIAGRAERLLLLSGAKSAQVDVRDPKPESARFEVLYFD